MRNLHDVHSPLKPGTSTTKLINMAMARAFSTSFLAVLTLAFSLGCNESKRASSGGLKVALLTPGPISDQSWNSGAYQGLMRIKDSLGAEVSHIQTDPNIPGEFTVGQITRHALIEHPAILTIVAAQPVFLCVRFSIIKCLIR